VPDQSFGGTKVVEGQRESVNLTQPPCLRRESRSENEQHRVSAFFLSKSSGLVHRKSPLNNGISLDSLASRSWMPEKDLANSLRRSRERHARGMKRTGSTPPDQRREFGSQERRQVRRPLSGGRSTMHVTSSALRRIPKNPSPGTQQDDPLRSRGEPSVATRTFHGTYSSRGQDPGPIPRVYLISAKAMNDDVIPDRPELPSGDTERHTDGPGHEGPNEELHRDQPVELEIYASSGALNKCSTGDQARPSITEVMQSNLPRPLGRSVADRIVQRNMSQQQHPVDRAQIAQDSCFLKSPESMQVPERPKATKSAIPNPFKAQAEAQILRGASTPIHNLPTYNHLQPGIVERPSGVAQNQTRLGYDKTMAESQAPHFGRFGRYSTRSHSTYLGSGPWNQMASSVTIAKTRSAESQPRPCLYLNQQQEQRRDYQSSGIPRLDYDDDMSESMGDYIRRIEQEALQKDHQVPDEGPYFGENCPHYHSQRTGQSFVHYFGPVRDNEEGTYDLDMVNFWRPNQYHV
jgi:hypothetical protein